MLPDRFQVDDCFDHSESCSVTVDKTHSEKMQLSTSQDHKKKMFLMLPQKADFEVSIALLCRLSTFLMNVCVLYFVFSSVVLILCIQCL